LYDGRTGQKPETIKYASRTGPSTKEKTKAFFRLTPVKEVKEDGVSAQEPSVSNTHFAQTADIERRGPIETTEEEEEEDEEIPELSLRMTVGLLVVVIALVAVTAKWLVDSIDGLTSGGGISREFIGLILLPIVGNAAEYVTVVTVSIKDKLTLSLGVAVGNSIVSFLLPFQCDRVKSLPSSKSRCASSHSPSSLDGSWVVRLPCPSTRSSRSCSSWPC
jgi:hypothetical protein